MCFFLHSKVGSTHLSGQRNSLKMRWIKRFSANLTKDQKPMTRRLVHELDDSRFSWDLGVIGSYRSMILNNVSYITTHHDHGHHRHHLIIITTLCHKIYITQDKAAKPVSQHQTSTNQNVVVSELLDWISKHDWLRSMFKKGNSFTMALQKQCCLNRCCNSQHSTFSSCRVFRTGRRNGPWMKDQLGQGWVSLLGWHHQKWEKFFHFSHRKLILLILVQKSGDTFHQWTVDMVNICQYPKCQYPIL